MGISYSTMNFCILFFIMNILKQFGVELKFEKKKTNILNSMNIDVATESHSNDILFIKKKNEPPNDGIVIFTDGASKGNGSKKSRAGCSVIFPDYPEYNIRHALPIGSTNNRAEYTAIQLAFEQINKLDFMKNKKVYIYTDSQLIIDSMTKWIKSWKRNNWKKSDGKPVLNQDILKRIDELSALRHVTYKHVRAHTGRDDWESIWNQRADDEANMACL